MASSRQPGSGSGGQGAAQGPGATRRRKRPYREPDRALARAGTRGALSGASALLIWSALFLVVGVVVIGLAYLATRPGGGSADVHAPAVLTATDIPHNGPTLGNANAPVTIDLYGDFRCSACFWFTVTGDVEGQVVDKYVRTGQAKLVWHDYLVIDHGDGATASRDAANAALCANDQGKFWLMHDWLYANQAKDESPGAFAKDRLLAIGQAAGLDMATFRPCVEQGTHDAEIEAEQTNVPAGIAGTPSVFINGKAISTGYVPTFEQISAAVEEALTGGAGATPASSQSGS
jgi:protein-disulfide isomerase